MAVTFPGSNSTPVGRLGLADRFGCPGAHRCRKTFVRCIWFVRQTIEFHADPPRFPGPVSVDGDRNCPFGSLPALAHTKAVL